MIRIYSGCPEGKKAELKWYQRVEPATLARIWASPTPDGWLDLVGSDLPWQPPDEWPEGGPPTQPAPDQDKLTVAGEGTPVGDEEGEGAEVNQEDVNSPGNRAPFGVDHRPK